MAAGTELLHSPKWLRGTRGHVALCWTGPGCTLICLAPLDKCLGCFYFFPWTGGAVENTFLLVSLLTCQSISETPGAGIGIAGQR